ncbi:MAG: hypothetical protein HZA91_09655 [Verrucomicrobia bacterium]|nr:hypothetical protein [Verrucomicrobiota bacterium]
MFAQRLAVIALTLALTGSPSAPGQAAPANRQEFSGIYPHLACFNDESECGTGAVVPWAGRLWVITYAPHKPKGSTDKLYEIEDQLNVTIRPESIGGTPANRMIHRESNQLFIGPYAIDAQRNVRVIPYTTMFGRPTGNARHLTDPANKIYYATMEEGCYEVDVKTLAVKELWADEQVKTGRHADLPGYHGKGFYSGQGRIVYANNGEHGRDALTMPEIPAGVLAEWDGKADAWHVVRRNQFTEVTGPGGIYGNDNPAKDPLWSIGWDHRSLILMLLDGGRWHAFRLPKASHCYDGAHGWNTEWPRIRDIGEPDLLMTMHGMFWRFPKHFSAAHTAGIAPRSTYLKVVGDFCRWNNRIVLGCDDTAKSEFLNKRKVKGNLAGPGQSQSNLRFLAPAQLDQLGPPLGRGAVWLNDPVKANEPSEPFLFAGFARRGLHLAHDRADTVTFTLETDSGDGAWHKLRDVTVAAQAAAWVEFKPEDAGAWVRVRADREVAKATATFHYSASDRRSAEAAPMFAGLAAVDAKDYSGGLIRARGDNQRTLAFAASVVRNGKVTAEGYYELDGAMNLRRVNDAAAHEWTKKNTAVPVGVITADEASVLIVDDAKRRWRLPRGATAFDTQGALPLRVDREVCTERDLFHAHGTFYELPADNAGGFAKIRPITTHNRRITDYCSYRGLLVISGIAAGAPANNRHLIRSDDGQCALWVGAVDDLWSLGKAVGHGGPWHNTAVQKDNPSDPYLLMGYDRKNLTLSHDAAEPVQVRVQVDITGSGDWVTYRAFDVKPGEPLRHEFPEGYQAYWLRVVASRDCRATATLVYE